MPWGSGVVLEKVEKLVEIGQRLDRHALGGEALGVGVCVERGFEVAIWPALDRLRVGDVGEENVPVHRLTEWRRGGHLAGAGSSSRGRCGRGER
jgi:hypothetical protein